MQVELWTERHTEAAFPSFQIHSISNSAISNSAISAISASLGIHGIPVLVWTALDRSCCLQRILQSPVLQATVSFFYFIFYTP